MSEKKPAPRLGRGLAALLGEQGRPERPGDDLSVLPVDLLAPGPFQPRKTIDDEALSELAASIRAQGVLQPILVRPDPARPGQFQIIAGERRWRAAQAAGLHQIPAHIRRLDDTSAMAAALIENMQRQDLNPIEEAEGLQRLTTDFELTQEKLADAIGKSRSHVANTLRLLALPEAVRHDVRSGQLTAGHARALLAHPDPARGALKVLAERLTVRQTEALAQAEATGERLDPERRYRDDASSRPPPRDPEIKALERELRAQLGLDIGITFNGRGGSVRIGYRNLDQLDGILALLRGGQ
ncbi:ParB family chromosome partitioning protein [Endobacter medicaginis]|uniref:ParB family chromosome partitioning protein n=1 Tax=Endobacter medicaginis TaxID=1181271 RepID=A0A850NQF2_9PROT|nr:ParB/RepB/Spo0J family partition protein [Endobacter medicaginis]MBB3172268.1 ParB family chromosome partitioning protein [Endobacter medicaginis]MCX5474612.1 ParB/RepB/Spo0J family partition protein [Endobacter medicaginis]NVN29208.1 ParB/RepB/Spo0J family partition protein [Endobacter medicaginis]